MKMEIRFFVIVLSAAVLASCGTTVNFATYNVCGFHHSKTNSMEMVASMMKEWRPDAISINELDSCTTRRGKDVYQLKDFAAAMGGWNYNFGAALDYKGGKYGIGIVTPHKIINSWSIRLPKSDDREYRALCVVETEKFIFCSTHIGLTKKSQMDQIDAIDNFIAQHFNGSRKPVFLCGDMNAFPESETLKALQKNWTVLSRTDDTTFSTHNPSRCIDYILLYKNAAQCKAIGSFVGKSFKTGVTDIASDHFPVFLKARL